MFHPLEVTSYTSQSLGQKSSDLAKDQAWVIQVDSQVLYKSRSKRFIEQDEGTFIFTRQQLHIHMYKIELSQIQCFDQPTGPFPVGDKQSKLYGMDTHILIDALAVIMGHEEKELCKPGNLALILILDTATTILGCKERVSITYWTQLLQYWTVRRG